jgi:hypothetical protein
LGQAELSTGGSSAALNPTNADSSSQAIAGVRILNSFDAAKSATQRGFSAKYQPAS